MRLTNIGSELSCVWLLVFLDPPDHIMAATNVFLLCDWEYNEMLTSGKTLDGTLLF